MGKPRCAALHVTHARVTCAASVSLLFSFYFEILIYIYTISPRAIRTRRQTESEKWNLRFIPTISTRTGIPDFGDLITLETEHQSEKERERKKRGNERNRITIVIHFSSIIVFYSVNLERRFSLVLTQSRNFSSNLIKF